MLKRHCEWREAARGKVFRESANAHKSAVSHTASPRIHRAFQPYSAPPQQQQHQRSSFFLSHTPPHHTRRAALSLVILLAASPIARQPPPLLLLARTRCRTTMSSRFRRSRTCICRT